MKTFLLIALALAWELSQKQLGIFIFFPVVLLLEVPNFRAIPKALAAALLISLIYSVSPGLIFLVALVSFSFRLLAKQLPLLANEYLLCSLISLLYIIFVNLKLSWTHLLLAVAINLSLLFVSKRMQAGAKTINPYKYVE